MSKAQALLVAEQVKSEAKQNELDGILDKQKLKLVAETTLLGHEGNKAQSEASLAAKRVVQADSEIALAVAQAALTEQQVVNLTAEAGNITKQGKLLEVQALLNSTEVIRSTQAVKNLKAEYSHISAQANAVQQQALNTQEERNNISLIGDKIIEEKNLLAQQVLNSSSERELIQANVGKATADTALTNAQKLLTDNQTANALKEGQVLSNQVIKTEKETLRIAAETSLLGEKLVTEKAQTSQGLVEQDSVIGRQKALYKAQADGFGRDAEQKAAKILVDSWNVRRTTDEGTSANTTNKLDDASVGRVVERLLTGVNA